VEGEMGEEVKKGDAVLFIGHNEKIFVSYRHFIPIPV
jgi:hypothetical protein